MPSNDEKKRRKAMVKELQAKERAWAEANLPLSNQDLSDLFDFVEERFADNGCDRTLRFTREFITQRVLPEQQVVAWLMNYGGGCDCEVLANVESNWRDQHGTIRHIGF